MGDYLTGANMRRRQASTTRYTALVLLLVMLGGLSITTFTRDFIGNLPEHDHLILGARAMGLVHHAHHGDALAQALQGTGTVTNSHEEIGRTDQLTPKPGGGGVISLKSLSGLQPELNSYTATGLLAPLTTLRLAERGLPLVGAHTPLHGGESPVPLLPPPRPA